MANLVLLLLDIWLISIVLIVLHYLSARVGFVPFMVAVGGLGGLLQVQFGIFIEPFDGISLFLGSNVLVSTTLMAVLILYVTNGAVPARMLIYSILGISLLAVVLMTLYRLHLSLPGSFSIHAIEETDTLIRFNLRTTLASLAAFGADMFVIAVAYQGVKNYAPSVPEWIVIGLSLTAALWTDAIMFSFISDFGKPDFLRFLPGDLVGKTLSALLLWPPTAFYLVMIAPKQPGYVGGKNRRTLDLLFGSFEEIKLALTRTEQALEQSETARRQEAFYFKQISDNINEGLWLAEPYRHHAFFVNPAYEQLWGRSATSIYADPGAFVNAIYPEDQPRVLAGLPGQLKGSYQVEYRIVRPDGSIRWVRDRAFPIVNAEGKVYQIAGISEDITEEKELEKQRLELAVEREKVKMLRDFISEASHDLKTPLSSINMKIYHLSRLENPARRKQVLEELQALASRLGGMVNDLLTLARLENIGDMGLNSLDLNLMIKDIIQGMHPQIEEKNLDINLKLDKTRPLMQCDQIDLSRAVANLIDNAVRYTPFGGQVTVETRVEENQIIIRVSDTGIGISTDDLPHIFERFFRSPNATATDPSGTGLGLAIVHKIVEQHNGKITVDSTVGEGTTFTLQLPLADL